MNTTAVRRKMRHLQANDPFLGSEANQPLTTGAPEDYLTEEDINTTLKPYVEKGVKVEFNDDQWFMTLHKQVFDARGRSLGGGPIKYTGTRRMPVKDLITAADELMIPITSVPFTPA